MSKRKAKGNAISYKGFLHIHRPLLDCSDFISLKGNSIKLLIDIAQQYNSRNNGDLCASLSVMRSRGCVRRQTLWNHLTLFLSDTFLPVTSPV